MRISGARLIRKLQPHLRFLAAGSALIVFVAAVFVVRYYYNVDLSPATVPSRFSLGAVGLAPSTSPQTIATGTTTTTRKSATLAVAAGTPAPLPSPAVSTSTDEAREIAISGDALLKSLVNIVCISNDPSIPSVSGSGVIIDSRGIILTAAHVAQMFLLQDYVPNDVQCLVRAGSPARRAYLAEPIYVSSAWIHDNPTTLTASSPTGNGEYDVALLGITATATSTPLPSSYTSVPLATADPQEGDSVAIASYGAQYLTGSEINYSLYPILVFGTIQNRYTYTTNTVDLFSIQGSAASQEGSSGGGVTNTLGQLIGIITTSSIQGSIQDRTLNAVTAGELRRTFTQDTGEDLDNTLASQSVPSLIAGFSNESKQLGQFLYQNIENQ